MEPALLPLDVEQMMHKTANRMNEALIDISARDLRTVGQRAFFDVRIFDLMASFHRELGAIDRGSTH